MYSWTDIEAAGKKRGVTNYSAVPCRVACYSKRLVNVCGCVNPRSVINLYSTLLGAAVNISLVFVPNPMVEQLFEEHLQQEHCMVELENS